MRFASVSPILWSRMKSRTSNAPLRWKNSANGLHTAATVARDALPLGGLAVPLGLAEDQRGQHRGQGERGAGEIGRLPA